MISTHPHVCTIRPHDGSDLDHRLFAEIQNLCHDDNPELPGKGEAKDHHFGVVDGSTVAAGFAIRYDRTVAPDRFLVLQMVHPEWAGHPIEPVLFDYLCEIAVAIGAACCHVPLEDRYPQYRRLVEDRGFRLALTEKVTIINPSCFDAGAFARQRRRLETEGFRFASLTVLDEEGIDWMPGYFRVKHETAADIPRPEPFKPPTYEQFAERAKGFPRDSCFVALFGGEVVARTELYPNKVNLTIANTHGTGTLHDFRRRGIASVLKAISLKWAKDQGIRTVYTENADTNPMYGLNRTLGFRDQFSILHYIKEIQR